MERTAAYITDGREQRMQPASAAVAQLCRNGKGPVALQDNRPQSAVQRKQVAAMNRQPIQKKANTTGLPDQLKSGIENLSGYSMDDVKVHYNSVQPAQLQAHAYAQGTDIHVAPGQEKHLPHEAWHVVQQKQGRVKPTIQLKGKVNVNDDDGLEKEADVMGSQAMNAVQLKANVLLQPLSAAQPVLQAKKIIRKGIIVDVPDDHVLQPGEYDFDASNFQHSPQVIFNKGKNVATYDKMGNMSISKRTEHIKTHDILQGERAAQGLDLAARIKKSPDLAAELNQIKQVAEKLEKLAGNSVPANHAAKTANLAKGKFIGDQFRGIIKGQDELTQTEATTSFFDGIFDGIGALRTSDQQQFIEQALRAFSALRTPTETVQAPILSGTTITGEQHPTSDGQEKMDGGGSGHTFADRLRVQKQVKAYNNLAQDPDMSAFRIIIGNLLNALVTTLGTMSHPGTADNVPDFNKARETVQVDEREQLKKQAAYLASILGLSVPSKSVKQDASLKSWDEPMSPFRSNDAADDGPALLEAQAFQKHVEVLGTIINNRLPGLSLQQKFMLQQYLQKVKGINVTSLQGQLAVYKAFQDMEQAYGANAGDLNRNNTPGGGNALQPAGHRVPVLEQFMLECGQMAVHNVLALDEAEGENNNFANLGAHLGNRQALAQHGNFENNIGEDQMRDMLQQAGRAGIPVIGNIFQLNTFINDYNDAEMHGRQMFHQPGYGRYLFQDQWDLTDVQTQEVMNMDNFLQGRTNAINFIINTNANQVLAAGYHWISVRVERMQQGQLALHILDSLQGNTDYSDMLNLLRQFINLYAN